ncbi:MAG: hypothetical protein ACE5KM_07245 [Planctomycetaceae bacterium]
MVEVAAQRTWLSEIAQSVRSAEPRAFLVPPRIVRRVIKRDREFSGVGLRVPHRKSYVVTGSRLRHYVDRDELGLSIVDDFPAQVFLLAEPKESELAAMSRDDLVEWTWRLLFHARIHFELDRRIESGEIEPSQMRADIDRIGQVEFDEAHSVLQREQFLIGRPDRSDVFVEFAAVYWEYKYFAPQRLLRYFPSLPAGSVVEEALGRDVDVPHLLEECRIAVGGIEGVRRGTGEPSGPATAAADSKSQSDFPQTRTRRQSPHKFLQLAVAAHRAAELGNNAQAALLHGCAAEYGSVDERNSAAEHVAAELDRLIERLQRALQFDDGEAGRWRSVFGDVVEHARDGFWNADRRMLSDLQKVCVDNERGVYKIDLVEWGRSLGKRPVKRPLPHQREVLVVKHLRNALGRLRGTRVSESARSTLSQLLHAAVRREEKVLRDRLRPVIANVLAEVGFAASDPVETVAMRKMVEEVLDVVVKRGYANMGALRDGISRNRLKLDDLSGPGEFFSGDRLLQADRKLAVDLDGVYRRADFYLRWLQRFSSIAFGTKAGRMVTLFALIPFGGAFMILSFFGHLLEKFVDDGPPLATWRTIGALGVFLMGLMHSPMFRALVWRGFSGLMSVLGAVFIDMPVWAIRNPAIRAFLRSPPLVLLRRFVFLPAVLTGAFCLALPLVGLYGRPPSPGILAIYLLLAAVLNSRMGRNVEEAVADWLEHTWYQIRTRVFVAIFEWTMAVFKSVLGFVERCLYAVDEWLRFRSGESRWKLVTKAIVGIVWTVVSFVATFCITLLIEPQVNPIKHFPVVTVSHKIILPMGLPMLSHAIRPLAGSVEAANAIAGTVVFLIPGIFGFLVWELRSNWRLYSANRLSTLRPAIVGGHGETMIRLLKPGFHSGTVPKLYGKIRAAVRKQTRRSAAALQSITDGDSPVSIPPKYSEALHHVEEAVRHFLEREFLTLLETVDALPGTHLQISDVRPMSNSISVDVTADTGTQPATLVFQEQSGRLVTGVIAEGWLADLSREQRRIVSTALAGLYAQSGAELVREQITGYFDNPRLRYDVDQRSLILWPDDDYEVEARYDLDQRPRMRPVPRVAAQAYGLPAISADRLIFALRPMHWDAWTDYWTAVAQKQANPPLPDPSQYVMAADAREARSESAVMSHSVEA